MSCSEKWFLKPFFLNYFLNYFRDFLKPLKEKRMGMESGQELNLGGGGALWSWKVGYSRKLCFFLRAKGTIWIALEICGSLWVGAVFIVLWFCIPVVFLIWWELWQYLLDEKNREKGTEILWAFTLFLNYWFFIEVVIFYWDKIYITWTLQFSPEYIIHWFSVYSQCCGTVTTI